MTEIHSSHADAEARAALLLSETREEIGRADQKVSVAFAALVVVIGALLAAALAGDWQPAKLTSAASAVWWIGSALLGIAVVLLAAALYPRTRNESTETFISYFGHVVAHRDVAQLRQALIRDAENQTPRTTEQLLRISQIVDVKYRLLKGACWTAGAGLAVCFVAALAG